MKWLAPFAFVLIVLAAFVTAVSVKALKPTSAGAFLFFAAWLVLPYVIMSASLLLLRRRGTASAHWYIVATIVSIGGILFMADVIFWQPDAQGAIAVLMTPILQAGASALLLPVVSWALRKAGA